MLPQRRVVRLDLIPKLLAFFPFEIMKLSTNFAALAALASLATARNIQKEGLTVPQEYAERFAFRPSFRLMM